MMPRMTAIKLAARLESLFLASTAWRVPVIHLMFQEIVFEIFQRGVLYVRRGKRRKRQDKDLLSAETGQSDVYPVHVPR